MAECGPIGLLALIRVERHHQDPGSKTGPGVPSVTQNAIAERFAVTSARLGELPLRYTLLDG